MEELKIIRDLNKTIKEEYIVDNAYEFSMALVNAGYTEISDDTFSGIATYIPLGVWTTETKAYWNFSWARVYDAVTE